MGWGSGAWGDASKPGCASPFWPKSRVWATATSRAARRQTWPSAATACTACGCCQSWAARCIRVVAELVCTTAGLVWLDPSHALLVVLAVLGMPALLLAMQPLLTERDLRVRTHAGALGRFSLDALLGLDGRAHPRGRTGHAPRVREPARRVDPRRAASATRRGQRRRRPGSPGFWASPPGSWQPIWPAGARRVGSCY